MFKPFEINAVFKNGHYYHFGILELTASVYGDKVEEIEVVTISISDNQNPVKPNEDTMEADYWGYYDYKKKNMSMIYPQYFLLNMCFPAGLKISEDRGEGKAYRLIVTPKERDK